MNILVIPVQSVSDLITNSSSEVFILETGKTCEEVNTILNTFTREDGKLFVATDDDKRYILKLVELPPIVASVNMGEHQTLFYINPETKEPVYRNKTTYETEKEAIHAAMVINVQDKTIHKRKLKIKHNIR